MVVACMSSARKRVVVLSKHPLGDMRDILNRGEESEELKAIQEIMQPSLNEVAGVSKLPYFNRRGSVLSATPVQNDEMLPGCTFRWNVTWLQLKMNC